MPNTDDQTENGQFELGECRIHPPMPLPVMSGDGKSPMMNNFMGINRQVMVYEFSKCVGAECFSHFCNIHSVCINICRGEHSTDSYNDEGLELDENPETEKKE